MAISPEAFQALQKLEDGAAFNCMHTIARELIDAGLAHAGFGSLEITEAGRIWVRRGVTPVATSYIVDDANVANLGGMSMPDPIPRPDPPQPPPGWHPPLALPPEPPPEPERLPPAPLTPGALAWTRDRAVRAAGAASGLSDHWPPPTWLIAFMDAYEHAGEQ
jgi:hypothetical protein